MTTQQYEKFVDSMCKPYCDKPYTVIALNGEAGEVAEWFKKFELRGNPTGKLTQEDLLSELGDVLFYVTRLAQLYGWSLDAIMETNQTKLLRRQAEGKRSIA